MIISIDIGSAYLQYSDRSYFFDVMTGIQPVVDTDDKGNFDGNPFTLDSSREIYGTTETIKRETSPFKAYFLEQ
eukprot:IDg19171t1